MNVKKKFEGDMESKAQYKLRLQTEISELSSEIGKLIVRTEMAAESKQRYDEIETTLLDKQSSTQAKLGESSLSRDEVWNLVWDNVWDAVKEWNRKAATDGKQDYKEIEPALQAKQSALQEQLPESIMSGDEVWEEVWSEVWGVVQEFNRKAAIEIKQISEELKVLFAKQSALQEKLHELLVSSDEVWNVLKEVSNVIVK